MSEFGLRERIIPFDGSVAGVGAARVAAEALADEMARMDPQERPDALLCFNDMNALGAMVGLRRKGLRIPEDIAIVGCDDLPIAEHLEVPLTTIAYPLDPLCRSAVRMLIERIRSEDAPPEEAPPPRTEQLQTILKIRESSRRTTG